MRKPGRPLRSKVGFAIGALALLPSIAAAQTFTVTGSGTWSAAAPTSTWTAPNGTWQFSVQISRSSLPPAGCSGAPGPNSVGFDVYFSNFTYSLNGNNTVPPTCPLHTVYWLASVGGGLELDDFDGGDNGFVLDPGTQLFTGSTSNPTLLTGTFPASNSRFDFPDGSHAYTSAGTLTISAGCQGCPLPNPEYYQFGFQNASPPPTNPWPQDVPASFGYPGPGDALCSTQKAGCALSSTASMLTTFSFFPPPLPVSPCVPGIAGQYASPCWLNSRLNSLSPPGYGTGYISGTNPPQPDKCELAFCRIPEVITSAARSAGATDVVQLVDGGGQILTWSDPSCDPTLTGVDCYLQTHICQGGDRVILVLEESIASGSCPGSNPEQIGPHYVFVTGESATGASDWNVFDPGYNPNNTTPSANLSTLSGHMAGFTTSSGNCHTYQVTEARTIYDSSSQSPSAFYVMANSPVELLLTDSLGRTLGDSNGTDVFGIPQGSYFRDFPIADDTGTGTANGDPTGIKTAYVPSPEAGTYTLSVTGTALGTYSLNFGAVATDNTSQIVTVSGVASVGSTSTYQTIYSPTPGSTPSVNLMATFTSALADISNSLALGLIDNQGNANALSSKINAASSDAGRGNYTAEANDLNAFINQVNALSGKHITGIAPQVLLADANSLLAQIP